MKDTHNKQGKTSFGPMACLASGEGDECKKLSAVHARIRAKVDFIWGEADPFFPLAEARTMFEQFPNKGEFAPLQKAKLLPYAEHPEKCAAWIRHFMQPVGWPTWRMWLDPRPARL